MYPQNQTPTSMNEGRTPYELFYKMKPDVEHIRTFRCVVKVILPSQMLGKLDDWAVMGYLLGCKYKGSYWVWIPKLGVQETRDVVFYEGEVPVMPVDSGTIKSRREEVQVTSRCQPTLAPPLPPPVAISAPSHDTEVDHEKNGVLDSPDIETSSKQLTIWLPGHYHPHAPQPQQHPEPISPQGDSEEPPASLCSDKDDDVPQYISCVHQFPARSTCSGLVRNAGGSGALFTFGAFEGLEPAFVPMLMTPDLQTTHDALCTPDANNWRAAMDTKIDNMQHLNVFKEVPRHAKMGLPPQIQERFPHQVQGTISHTQVHSSIWC